MTLVSRIVDQLECCDPDYGKKVRVQLEHRDQAFQNRAEQFFSRYLRFIEGRGQTLEFGVDCFLKMRESMVIERAEFLRNGCYSSTSFEEVDHRVYSNPEIMQIHMHGLVFAQFLWPEQYTRFDFFVRNLAEYIPQTNSYLEIGGGHGLYLAEAIRQLGSTVRFDLVDVSPHSIELAKGILMEPSINYQLLDVFELPNRPQFSFITMGEVLEHVERPRELLAKVHDLLAANGAAYITTPANAPMVDHIYLFRNASEIRDMLTTGGFTIEREVTEYAEELPSDRAEKLKMPMMYAAFVRRA